MPSRGERIATELAAKLRLHFGDRLVSVRLFGSWARGDQTPDSDVDVCVLIANLTRAEKIDVFGMATELMLEEGLPVQTLVMDPSEFERLRALEARLALDILREGIAA